MDYQLTLTAPGQPPAHRTITGTSPADLAQEVHRHARGWLGTGRLAVEYDADALTGTVLDHGRPAAAFTLTPADEPAPGPARDDGLLWGWTAADIDAVARHAVHLGRWYAMDADEHLDAVRHAIIEHLLTAETPPSRRDLRQVGLRAGDERVARELHHHGWSHDNLGAGPGGMPGFQRYWATSPTPSPEGRVVTALALTQIWQQLTHREQRALQALAETGDYRQAGRMLWLEERSYANLVGAARRRFLAWWHEGETPSRPWRHSRAAPRDGTCRGAPRLTASQIEQMRRRRHDEQAPLRVLAAEYGVAISTVSRYLRGTVTPAPDPAGAR